jgi:hypothetical protein
VQAAAAIVCWPCSGGTGLLHWECRQGVVLQCASRLIQQPASACPSNVSRLLQPACMHWASAAAAAPKAEQLAEVLMCTLYVTVCSNKYPWQYTCLWMCYDSVHSRHSLHCLRDRLSRIQYQS